MKFGKPTGRVGQLISKEIVVFYTYIYSHSNIPFYVGKGQGNRAYKHLKRTDRHPMTQKLNKLHKQGIEPVVEIINASNEVSAFWLERCLIAAFGRKEAGTGTLLNLTDGGEGSVGWIPSKATKANQSAAIKRALEVPATRAKVNAGLRAVLNTPEVKERHRVATKAALNTPEAKANLSAGQSKRWAKQAAK